MITFFICCNIIVLFGSVRSSENFSSNTPAAQTGQEYIASLINELRSELLSKLDNLTSRMDNLTYTLTSRMDNLTSRMDNLTYTLTSRMDNLTYTLTSRMDNLTSKVDTLTSRMDNLTSSVDTRFSDLNSALELVPRQVHTFLHNFNRHKVEVMHQSMRSMKVCENKITVHYVLWNDKVLGLTVAHTPCFWKDKPPPEFIACQDMDVSLIKSCPPAHSGLLNLTGSVTVAQLGDEVMSCGFASVGAKRCWFGTVAGKWGNTVKSVHFTSKAFEHEEYILIAGASQDQQMSGSAVLNGYGYLGMANAVVTDILGNESVVIIPFGLYDKCIQKNARNLMSVSDCKGVSGTYNIMEVPKLFSNEPTVSTEVLSLTGGSEL